MVRLRESHTFAIVDDKQGTTTTCKCGWTITSKDVNKAYNFAFMHLDQNRG